MKQNLLELTDFINDRLTVSIIEYTLDDNNSLIRVKALQAAYRTRIDSLNKEVIQILDNQNEEFEARN